MTGNSEARHRLAEYIQRRVGELALEWIELERASGVSIETIRKIRNGKRVAARTYRKLEYALRLPPFTIDTILEGRPPDPPTPAAQAGGDPLTPPSAPAALTKEELDHPVVRRVHDLEGLPEVPLTIEDRVTKARETHQLIQAGEINPTVHHLDDPTVRTILAMTGQPMAYLWDVALHDWDKRAEIARRRAAKADENRDAG